jgi:CysZ protein
MDAFFSAAFRALRSLFIPGMMGVFIFSIIATIIALFIFFIGASAFFGWLSHALQDHAFASVLPWLGSIGAALLAWFLFPTITPVIVSFFDIRITRLIERNDYPSIPQPGDKPVWPELLHDIRFVLVAVGLNILVLPLYLLPGLNIVLFYLLNGYLLGREYFVTAARRHIPVEQAEAMRLRHGRVIMLAGIALAVMTTIPVINLFSPFWGVAMMVHLYHRLNGTPSIELLPPHPGRV